MNSIEYIVITSIAILFVFLLLMQESSSCEDKGMKTEKTLLYIQNN